MYRITTRRELAGCVGSTQFGTETNASSLTAERIHLLRLVCLASWSSPLTAHARLLSSPDTQGPRPRADATSEPHGRPPPPCTELDHGELLIPRPCLRRAHPASSSSTAPDMREKGASRCKGQGPKCEARCAGIDPSRTLELHCSSTASVSFSLRLQQAPQALAFESTTQALLMVVFATITTDGVKSLPPSCSALDLHGV